MEPDELEAFAYLLKEDNQVLRWPKKQAEKMFALHYLATKFDAAQRCSEKQVNAILGGRHLFDDHAMLRRELVVHALMDRTTDGSAYWRLSDF